MTSLANICVVIPTYNAEKTIGAAVLSALAQPEVVEVIVVDDCSSDKSAESAEKAGAGDARLTVIRQQKNGGPAAARNAALQASRADFIALLDSDDVYAPQRFSKIVADEPFDMIADNIAFVPEDRILDDLFFSGLAESEADCSVISLENMIEGNISRPGEHRAELGFLKPIISRAFLEKHGLKYQSDLRLGEDFDLYLKMLAKGAVFLKCNNVGYVARVRADSLSGSHSGRDLEALYHSVRASRDNFEMSHSCQNQLDNYLSQLRQRFLLHRFLETKRENGLLAAALYSVRPLSRFLPISTAVLRDKLQPDRTEKAQEVPAIRYLYPV
ncbi:glycosyltransferase family 2 protein [Cognatishimia activa]|uniref:Putative glycosyltransferase EpsJ n=1 Tax=Cognatishimia activa TaxID=1715691 RepID=A0A0P1IVE3_9RHOB|nr:glycosyltransferase family 2 protein [Cognatishimia activa]CUJ18826.1 putative glycosyltransferase EpsJ [Cognatishimia activa]CUK27613.1 putative glycosyltransferase EpsJ [Cognatishimia activa]